jgi:hypothetical protein
LSHPFQSILGSEEPSSADQRKDSIAGPARTVDPKRSLAFWASEPAVEKDKILIVFPPKVPILRRSELFYRSDSPDTANVPLPPLCGCCFVPQEITPGIKIPNVVTLRGNPPAVSSSFQRRRPLKGGTYDEVDALILLNSWFVIVQVKGAWLIAQIEVDGSLFYIPLRDLSLKLRNIFVRKDDCRGGFKIARAQMFWLEHPSRHEREVVFNPGAAAGAFASGKYNLWRGFDIVPSAGRSKQRRLLRHIWVVICRRDRIKFRYLIRWLAWAVQNPDQSPGTVIVLKSRTQGTGKSTLSYVMRDLFGKHARVFDNKERLFGRFNADLETVCFACAEEMLWAGDRSAADALKSLITGDTLTLEVKNGSRWDVPNRLHMMMTTNHEHAVQAGVSDRRFFVLDVSDEKAQDVRWFEPLYEDLAEGGKEQFLQFLLNVNLTGWHPRNLPKTADTVAQQRMSADTVARWIQSCIDDDSIVGHAMGPAFGLGTTIPSENLRTAYTGYCSQHKMFPVAENVFGRALTMMLGEPVRLSPTGGNTRRPRAYHVPDANELQIQLDGYLGLAKR